MSLPLFFDKKPRYTVFGQNECTGRLQKVVENQVSVSQFLPASWASVGNRLCIRQVDAWVRFYILGLIQESGMQTKYSKISVCLCLLGVIHEGVMQASTPTSGLVFVS